MATSVAVPASPVVSPPSPSPNSAAGGNKRGMFRTLSRFLSGGTHKPKPATAPARVEPARTNSDPVQPSTSESSRGSLLSTAHDDHDDDRDDRTASSMVAQYPNDSLSHLSIRSSSSQSSVRSTSTSRSLGRTPRTRDDGDYDDADTDASIYRLPPSTRGPSSITSRRTHDSTTSSFAPTHASTYRSVASTKPTTLLSVDSGGGANRIAVVAPSSSSPTSRSQPSAPTFSSLSPASPPFAPSHHHRPSTSSTNSSLLSLPHPATSPLSLPADSPSTSNPGGAAAPSAVVGVPSHTHAHPRNNPLPHAIPPDNASLLTLASSSFAPSFTLSTHTHDARQSPVTTPGAGGDKAPLAGGTSGTSRSGGGATTSWGGGGLTSLKAWSQKRGQTGGSSSSKLVNSTSGTSIHDGLSPLGGGGGGGGGGGDADEDASVRVLPGSRRNSDESLGARSTWSAMVPPANPGTTATGIAGSRKSVLSDKDHPPFGERERRRSSMRTVETGYTGGDTRVAGERVEDGDDHEEREQTDGEEEALETETEEGETEAQGVKKRAEERHDSHEKGKAVDEAEHAGRLAPPVPLVQD
ncbi:hypothetical protein JCM11491_002525 [Sporobolomyces phaffii]